MSDRGSFDLQLKILLIGMTFVRALLIQGVMCDGMPALTQSSPQVTWRWEKRVCFAALSTMSSGGLRLCRRLYSLERFQQPVVLTLTLFVVVLPSCSIGLCRDSPAFVTTIGAFQLLH